MRVYYIKVWCVCVSVYGVPFYTQVDNYISFRKCMYNCNFVHDFPYPVIIN